MPNTNIKSGQTLIEVTVALGVASIVIVALVILATNSLRNAQDAIRRTESTKLASTGVEAVTFYRNVEGLNVGGIFPTDNGAANATCVRISASGDSLDYLSTGGTCAQIEVTSPGTGLSYNRSIKIERRQPFNPSSSVYEYEVTSTVTWVAAGDELNEVTVSRVLTNWNE